MTEPTPEPTSNARPAETPGANTKRKHTGGRPPKSFYQVPVQSVIDLTAPVAARIIQAHIERKPGYRTLPAGLLSACYYVIDHSIGKAKIKIEHSGGILTYNALAKSAGKLEEKPRPILADAMAVAQKYQEKTTESPGENPETEPKTDEA